MKALRSQGFYFNGPKPKSFMVISLNTRIATLKFVDRYIGGAFARLLSPPQRFSPGLNPRSFLVIRPGGIGDAVHLVPLLHLLHKSFPSASITLLAEKRNARIFDLTPVRLTVLRYDSPGEFIRALYGRYDVVIDTEQWHYLSAIIARLVRAPMKIGFASNKRQQLFTDPLPYLHTSYEADIFLSLLSPLSISAVKIPAEAWLRVPAAAYERIATLSTKIHGRYIVVFPGASVPSRRWGGERFRALCVALREAGWQVVVVGGLEDCKVAAEICRDGVGHDLTGKTTLAETAALIEGAVLLVSGDSGILHVGAGLGIPTVSLFGPGIAQKWGPRGEQHLILNLQLPCSPCTQYGTTPDCNKHSECMTGISVDAVINAVKKQLHNLGID